MATINTSKSSPTEVRPFLRLLVSLGLQAVCYLLALGLRFDFSAEEFAVPYRLTLPISLLLLSRSLATFISGAQKRRWSYVSLATLGRWIQTLVLGSLFFSAAVGMLRIPSFPRSVVIIEFFLSLVAISAVQATTRLLHERSMRRSANTAPERQAILLGAGAAGELLVKQLLSYRGLGFVPVAFLDDSERLQGTAIYGVAVEGKLADLETALSYNPQVEFVFSAIPSLSAAKVKELRSLCARRGVSFKRLQSFEDILLSDATADDTLDVSRLLEREHHIESAADVRAILSSGCVLVTGAGGSIGSELVRQIVTYNPSRVVAFDSSEYNLFRLRSQLAAETSVPVSYVLGSIVDRERLERTFTEHAPALVFHAAAYKHVSMIEANSYEAFSNNILGTRNLLEVAAAHQVERFVLISSDKAVEPKGLMGASKRIAELLVLEYSNPTPAQAPQAMRTSAVRFGNVLNSSGSVVPIFLEQIRSGGPVTVTHPEMERYFMSIREAVSLVLSAAALPGDGEIYVLNMGRPIKILDLARRMLTLLRREDIEIAISGIREGEQLQERLISDSEQLVATELEKILRVKNAVLSHDNQRSTTHWVAELQQQLTTTDDRRLRLAILQWAQQSFLPATPQRRLQAVG